MPDVTALPQPGDTFAGKYLIERVIGSGRTSLVFSARHRVTGKRFAIEWLLPTPEASRHDAVIADEGEDPEEQARGEDEDEDDASDAAEFLRDQDEGYDPDDPARPSAEHQVVGHFRHPNVLEVYDVGEQLGSLYTVMDWSEGESLEARLSRTGPLSIADACRLLIPCMRGMHEAHRAGILHRDLKPANIFVCQSTKASPEVAKVLDFEVDSRLSSDEEQSVVLARVGESARVPYYRAPEQLGGLATDHRVDVYAFGAILYEVLSGRPPFAPTRASSPASVISSAYSLSLQTGVRHLPVGADSIVRRAMARNVEQRFQTLGELADALEAYAQRAAGVVTRRSAQLLAEIAQTQPMAAVDAARLTATPYSTESVRRVTNPQDLPQQYAPQPYARPIAKGVYIAGAVLSVLLLGLGVRYWARRDTDVVATYEAAVDPGVAVVELSPAALPPTPVRSADPPAEPRRAEPVAAAPELPSGLDPELAAASRALDATMKLLQAQDPEGAKALGLGATAPPAAAATDSSEPQAIRLPMRAFPPGAAPKLAAATKPPSAAARAPSSRPSRPQAPRTPAAPLVGEAAQLPPTPHVPKPRSERPVERDPLDMNLM